MTYGGGMLSFASALGVASALLIVAAGTATASHLDLWQTEGNNYINALQKKYFDG